ncbi:hypothetical protein [Streptomyces sp. NBC_00102]|uniref:hypothetical protein n=1 Tax=Streptomyces sp. NBC_00102 TaxID=2975652 RepID=UPI0022548B06|nr:hypothetical protein [Streptomyces sp. NBC_00102]MCX5397122.1 hypothetical protein [Streptomyces sp. NBC_00102]
MSENRALAPTAHLPVTRPTTRERPPVPRSEVLCPPLGVTALTTLTGLTAFAALRRPADPLRSRRARRHATGRDHTGRPAWQSPYGPPRHRAHRGRWAPVPGVADAPTAVRHGYLCGRCE